MRARVGRSAATGAGAASAAAAVFLISLAGCGDGNAPTAPGAPGAIAVQAAGDATYTTRGRIEKLPESAGATMRIQHEAIPGFRNKAGEIVGMDSMTMSFMPAAELDLSGVAAGDPVEFTWEMRWNTRPNTRVTRMTKLGAGAELNFGPAPAGGHFK
jgi:hypothetical protein